MHRDGFSLVEVAIALAVISIAVTAILSTWPSGQDHLRRSADITFASQIAQRLVSEAEQANFSDVLHLAGLDSGATSGSLPRRYFSDAGREVAEGDATRMYEVLTLVSHSEQLPVQQGGSAQRWDSQGHLVLTIEVALSPSGTKAPVGANGLVDRSKWRRPVHTFPLVVGGNSTW